MLVIQNFWQNWICSTKYYLQQSCRIRRQHNWTRNFPTGTYTLNIWALSTHLFANIESIQGIIWEVECGGTLPISISTSRNGMSLKFAPCAMTTYNNIDCVTWLVRNLQTRGRFLNMSSKNENDIINQLLLSRSQSFKVLSCL